MEEVIQPLNRVALELGPISIYWYGVIIAIGGLIGFTIANKEAVRLGFHKDTFTDLILWALPIALISARVYYVIFSWDYYSQHLKEVFAIWEGGIAIHGALIGATITAVIFSKKRKLSFWKLADIAAPGILIGQAIGRWGNFMNQEAHGGATSREFLDGLMLPDWIINQMLIDGQYYQPTFLYESIWSLIGVVVLIALRKVNLKRGEMFLTYIIWYSVGRFFVEGLRTDSLMLTDTLRMAQVLSIALIIASITIMVYRRTKGNVKFNYNSL